MVEPYLHSQPSCCFKQAQEQLAFTLAMGFVASVKHSVETEATKA
jgi:hypothetical protein